MRAIVTWIGGHIQTLHYYTKALSLGLNTSSVHTTAQKLAHILEAVVLMHCKQCTTLVVRTLLKC